MSTAYGYCASGLSFRFNSHAPCTASAGQAGSCLDSLAPTKEVPGFRTFVFKTEKVMGKLGKLSHFSTRKKESTSFFFLKVLVLTTHSTHFVLHILTCNYFNIFSFIVLLSSHSQPGFSGFLPWWCLESPSDCVIQEHPVWSILFPGSSGFQPHPIPPRSPPTT